MKFFLDANMPYSALNVFHELHLEGVHARDVELSEASDDEILAYAIKSKSILITKDMGFANIIRFRIEPHFGIVILRLPHFFKTIQILTALKAFLSSVDTKLLPKAITIVKLDSYRIRRLK